jgi:hypothetical protein
MWANVSHRRIEFHSTTSRIDSNCGRFHWFALRRNLLAPHHNPGFHYVNS